MTREVEIELLPHQYDLMSDITTEVMGLASGFGGGKTFVAAYKHVYLMTMNKGVDSIFAEPTNALLVQLAFPALEVALNGMGIKWKLVKSPIPIYTCIIGGVKTRLVCTSMENYERIIGLNCSHITLDEFDTTKADIAYKAFEKLIGRMRAGNVRQMNIVSTPEGFRAMYQIFVSDLRKKPELAGRRRIIHAKTLDNKVNLPEDFIERMYRSYDSRLVEAYINGQFVNMNSGVIYHQYSSDLSESTETIQPGETLFIGQDFNVGKMASVVFVERVVYGDEVETDYWNHTFQRWDRGMTRERHLQWHAVGEITDGFDTESTIATLKERYQQGEPGDDTYHEIIIYPDASGQNRKSVNASVTDISLLEEAGFEVRCNPANPPVKDRINAVNVRFKNAKGERKLFVNSTECPELVDCLRRQAWDKKTGEPEKGGDNDPSHMCFSGDTMIMTSNGLVMIKDASRDGFVDNGFGRMVGYRDAEYKGDRITVSVVMDDGSVIRCTPDHKFITEGGEWIEAQNLKGKRLLLSQKQSNDSSVIAIECMSDITTGLIMKDCIALCGGIISGIFRKVFTSITRTRM